jgi:hypothetical protein
MSRSGERRFVVAISTTCPCCKQTVEGTLEDIRRHYGACVAKAGRSSKTPTGRPKREDPRSGEKPALVRVVFFIPGEATSSLNVMLHDHRGQTYADKQRWRDAVAPVLGGYEPAKNRRRVEIFRSSRRDLDPDNLAGSMKYLVDAIKDAGALVDDSAKWIELVPTQGWSPREGKGMLVRITDLGEGNADEEGQEGGGVEAEEGLPPAPPA